MWTRRGLDRKLWAASYVQTYLERDVRSLLQVGDLGAFQTFLRLVAARTGQLLNLSDLARDTGISHPTARQWLAVLEASHQILLLRPYHANVGKRLVKSPKVYFLDTGLAAYLCGLHDEEALVAGPLGGPLLETAVVAEFLKAMAHRGEPPTLHFFRSHDGWEVDLVVERGGRLFPFEIKLTRTPRPIHGEGIARFRAALGPRAAEGAILCDIPSSRSLVPGVRAVPWNVL